MKRKNMISMVTSLALVGVVAIGGTLALLSQQSNTVTNTFTIGNAYPKNALTLDEADVEQVTSGTTNYGGYVVDTDAVPARVQSNAYENLVADTTLDKDPTFHLAAESPDSWIIAKVEGVDELATKGITINGQLPSDYGWLKLNIADGTTAAITGYDQLKDGYYVTKAVVAGGTDSDDLFEQLKVGTNVTRGQLDSIVVSGVAVESVTDDWTKDGAAVVAQAETAGFIQ